MLRVDKTKCQGCGACVNVCPAQAISLIDDIASIDTKKCVECGKCVAVCPAGAISLGRRNIGVGSHRNPMPPFKGGGMAGGFRRRRRGRGRGFFR